jgi:uncharacterized protein with von Willebrand factor type A (vWA) domain
MEKKLIDFIQRLRQAGVRVSVAESIDAFQAVQFIKIENRENFRVALRSCLVKEIGDYPIFDKLFKLFFSVGFLAPVEQKEANQKIEEELGAERFQQELQEFEQTQKMSESEFLRELEQIEQKTRARQGDENSARMDEENFLKELEFLSQMGEEPEVSSDFSASNEAEEQFQKELERVQKEMPKPNEADKPQEEKSKPSEMKESLDTQEVTTTPAEDSEEESKQGGESNQHNDILQQQDFQKPGGGESQNADGQSQASKEGQAAEGQAETGTVDQEGQGPGGQENQVADGDQNGKEGSGSGQLGQAKELSLSEKIAKAILEGDKALMREIAREGAKQVEIKLDSLRSAQSEAGQKLNLWEIRNHLQQELSQQMGSDQANEFLEQAFSKLEDELASAIEEEAVRRFGEKALDQITRRPRLEEIDFNNLRYDSSMDLIEEMRVRIAKLAHKLASRISRREKAARAGKVSIGRTIRKSLQTGGVPLVLAFRQRKLAKPELVLLCDVSGSVAVFSEFMLQLVYALQDRFTKVRTFAFVDRIDEITSYFKEDTVAEAIRRARSSTRVSWGGYSDYGSSFIGFVDRYLEAVTSKTTVIVLGDARNNNNPPRVESLSRIRERAKKLLWLNPEPVELWDTGDSIMGIYAHVCDQVFECRNLRQLEHVVEKILK